MHRLTPLLIFILCCGTSHHSSFAQSATLFDSDQTLSMTLSGNINELLKDRSTTEPQYHTISLSYIGDDGHAVNLPIQAKTRGHFRRLKTNCVFPPLLLNFEIEGPREKSIFEQQNKLKLVTPCRDERYVVREYLVYKLHNLITSKSFRARLVKVTYDDTEKGKKSEPLYGILLEEEEQMAKRNGSVVIERKLVKPEHTLTEDFLKTAVFEYLIGNTDWSVQYRQNIKLIAPDSLKTPSTVAYDFDHAGIVGAPYAQPAEQLMLSSTRERRYRGYCIQDMSQFDNTISFFNRLKDDIYKTYTQCPLLEESYVKSTVRFLDDFYKTINNPKTVKSEFGYPCRQDGTGNVVITGLDKN